MTTVWPSTRAAQKTTIDQLMTDLRYLERKYVAATATTTEKKLASGEVRDAWDILYAESPVYDSRVLQFDPDAQLISGVYRAAPSFELVALPPPDPAWTLIDEYYMGHEDTSPGLKAFTLPQTYEKIVITGNVRLSETSANPYATLQWRVNGSSATNYWDFRFQTYATDTGTSLAYAGDSSAKTTATILYSSTDNAQRYNSSSFMLEFPGYYLSSPAYTLHRETGMAWCDNPSTAYYLGWLHNGFGFFANALGAPVNSLQFYATLNAATAFLPGTNLQVYGVFPDEH